MNAELSVQELPDLLKDEKQFEDESGSIAGTLRKQRAIQLLMEKMGLGNVPAGEVSDESGGRADPVTGA